MTPTSAPLSPAILPVYRSRAREYCTMLGRGVSVMLRRPLRGAVVAFVCARGV